MLTPQFNLPIHNELVVDLFAGGGGASTGIEAAIGRSVDIAINHDEAAIAMHTANHPQTKHYCSDIFEVDPVEASGGRPVGLLWASPSCTHFSKARGGTPVSKQLRSLAWVVVRWASKVRPRVIMMENVEEMQFWGPVVKDKKTGGFMPCKKRKGKTFDLWIEALKRLGYQVEWKTLVASDYGAPTIRKRLFLVARCDGMPIEWPQITHGNPKAKGFDPKRLKEWRTAAECIDWSIPCPSIFDRKKPLAESTLKRIAKGVVRYVIETGEPFIVGQGGPVYSGKPSSTLKPLGTVPTENHRAIVVPALAKADSGALRRWRFGCDNCGARYGVDDYERNPTCPKCGESSCSDVLDEIELPYEGADEEELENLVAAHISSYYGHKTESGDTRGSSFDEPLKTQTTENRRALVSAFLAKHYTGVLGQPLDKPTGTVTTVDHHSVVTAHMTKFNTGSTGFELDTPMHTIIAGGQPKRPGTAITQGLVTSHMVKLRGDNVGSPVNSPLHTVTAGGTHAGEVRALLVKYYGNEKDGVPLDEPLHTIPTKDRFGLVIVHLNGEPYVIVDIGMRMLQPHELYLAQGFPESYIHEFEFKGKPLSKTNQVKMVGNSVCPPIAQALVAKNYVDKQFMEMAA
ncbi:DNA cytosine methyltransferase [Polynucleobacter sp. JS-Safj-400b-B2]|uniref:DNA cytosine methyltransferase n=1 Tax=Polynucleobacter sp. JS-Safj-400b-B2 TaxID=2576921 RepID=UPI001C0E1D0E|nr:DNA cytosine methyltransferase [Polynucleobacter sp. JS-Safj-400b-B2]MBU3625958.1 DNA cytosine methyltransferase [Polynucleobacter sp. JS-Safj-400b-B2]